MRKKILVSWSSGKDSAWALHVLRQRDDIEIVGLLTTLNQHFDRVAMHGVRRVLVQSQAKAAGLPLWEAPLPWPCSNQEYEQVMAGVCAKAIENGITAVAFGDLFLEDVRKYREDQMKRAGLEPIFPIWGRNTRELLEKMLAAGLHARIVCVDPSKVPAEFAGRDLDFRCMEELPAGVDPCGENGEFHTFVYDGPMFACPIAIESGEIVTRDNFVYADVFPAGAALQITSAK